MKLPPNVPSVFRLPGSFVEYQGDEPTEQRTIEIIFRYVDIYNIVVRHEDPRFHIFVQNGQLYKRRVR